jgi:hypothetical protein
VGLFGAYGDSCVTTLCLEGAAVRGKKAGNSICLSCGTAIRWCISIRGMRLELHWACAVYTYVGYSTCSKHKNLLTVKWWQYRIASKRKKAFVAGGGGGAIDIEMDSKLCVYYGVTGWHHIYLFICISPIPVATRSKARACGRWLAGIAGSNPSSGMDVCLLYSVVCFGPITRPEDS